MYNVDIPGQISEYQLQAIEAVAKLVPAHGTVVEVGSLFGRSSYAWSQSVDETATVHCIDPWEGNQGIRSMEQRLGIKYGLEQFQAYTRDCRNIVAHKGYSPADFTSWDEEVDLYYEDAVHANPVLLKNLEFWVGKLKPGGIVCGDDYRPRFVDVVCEVQRLAHRLNRKLITVDFFWCLLPECGSSLVRQVENELARIQARHLSAKARAEASFTFEIGAIPKKTKRGDSLLVPAALTNDRFDTLPVWFSEWGMLLRLQHTDSDYKVEDLIPIEPFLFQPDIARDLEFRVEIPGEAPRGEYLVETGILNADAVIQPGVRTNAIPTSLIIS